MKINIDESAVRGTIEIGDEKITYKAYPASLDITLMLIEAQEEENDKKALRAYSQYFDECIEFEGFGAKRTKEKVRKALERSGKFMEFVTGVFEELGKKRESKG